MATGPFSPTQFTATQFDSAEVKAAFGNHFLHFVTSDFKRSLFTKSFYNRLSMCFSHIAHHNVFGFYETWFADDRAKLSFLVHTLRFPCYGDPAFTYSDVEREIQREIRRTTLVSDYQRRVEAATRNRELAELERLQAKSDRRQFTRRWQWTLREHSECPARRNPCPTRRMWPLRPCCSKKPHRTEKVHDASLPAPCRRPEASGRLRS
jgi:hypothetical protein